MEEHLAPRPGRRRAAPRPALSLEIGRRRFPILALEPGGCTIEISGEVPGGTPGAVPARGYASILDGDRLLALCLITLAAPAEGAAQRIVFKRRTAARLAPPVDYPL